MRSPGSKRSKLSPSRRRTPKLSSPHSRLQVESPQSKQVKSADNNSKRTALLLLTAAFAALLIAGSLVSTQNQQTSLDSAGFAVVVGGDDHSKVTPMSRCRGTEYVSGSWQFDPAKTQPSFSCCDGYRSQYRDHQHCGTRGSDGFAFSGDETWPAQIYGHESDCLEWGFLDRYTWVPSECILPPWNAQEFCEILGNKTVLMIGDSLTRQSATTLINNIMFSDKEHRTNQTCQTQIHYRIADTLVGRLYSSMNRGKNWKQSVREIRPDLVILNVGGHVASLESFLEVIREVKRDVEEEILPEFPDLRLIWRTIVPAGCQNNILERPPKEILGYWDEYAKQRPTHGFDLHSQWDAEAKKLWLGNDHFQIIDMEPLAYRTDAHPDSNKTLPAPPKTRWDCFHWCIPGPLDLFSRIFLNTLKDLREQQHW